MLNFPPYHHGEMRCGFMHTLGFKDRFRSAFVSGPSHIYISTYVLSCNWNRQTDYITHFLYTCLDLAESEKCDIRFILDAPKKNRPNHAANSTMIRWLYLHDIPVRVLPGKAVGHMKLAIFGHQVAFFGSHNLAMSSLNNPGDMSLEITHRPDVRFLFRYYQELWQRCELPALLQNLPAKAPPSFIKHDWR